MKKKVLIISSAVLFLLYFGSCNSGTTPDNSSISKDSATIAAGEGSFTRYCSGCHNLRQDGIGPKLGGLTAEVPVDWIQHFIRDPKKIIESGDERAGDLIKKYKVAMPSFVSLKDDEVNSIIAFIHSYKLSGLQRANKNGKELLNPI